MESKDLRLNFDIEQADLLLQGQTSLGVELGGTTHSYTVTLTLEPEPTTTPPLPSSTAPPLPSSTGLPERRTQPKFPDSVYHLDPASLPGATRAGREGRTGAPVLSLRIKNGSKG